MYRNFVKFSKVCSFWDNIRFVWMIVNGRLVFTFANRHICWGVYYYYYLFLFFLLLLLKQIYVHIIYGADLQQKIDYYLQKKCIIFSYIQL